MTTETWHAGPELMARYAAGALDLAAQSAVESHVSRCEECRSSAARAAPTDVLDAVWDSTLAAIAAPPASALARTARRLGVHENDTVILRASTGLHRPWLLALVGTLAFAIVGSMLSPTDQRFLYLMVAPLTPALIVAAAYDATDPVRELVAATPYSKLRIALLRTFVAVLFALPGVLVLGLLLPFVGGEAFAWLLPSLALTLLVLNLLTWLAASVAAGLVAGAWLLFVALLRAEDQLSMASVAVAQLAFAALAIVAFAVLVVRILSFRAPGGFT
jgi:hypothetical protein